MLGAVGVSRADTRAFYAAERELLEALGRQGGQALERARLYRRQQLANDRLYRLQATTAALARALTPREVAATAAEQGRDALGADSAWVALLDEQRRALELAHAAGHGEDTLRRFQSLPLDAELPLAEAARTTTPLWLESAEAIFGPYPRFREVRPQAQSAALLPLADGGVSLGAIGLVFDRPRVFRPHDRDFLLTLTRLCGQALGRARRYQTEHDLASTLQQALLPEELPRADGLELAVRYLPAEGAAAGGDFYDAVELPGGRLGLAVGDIVGHGAEAAAAMGQLRSALRAYALEGRSPARVLQLLSRYADGVTGARGATLVYAVVDPAAREVRYAAAGHPPPLLVAPNGRARYLEGARGVPLDRALGHVYEDAVTAVPEGSTLVLYSDGAIERRGEPLDAGLERLRGGRRRELPARPGGAVHAADRGAAGGYAAARRRGAAGGARARADDRAAAAVVRGAAGSARRRARGDAQLALVRGRGRGRRRGRGAGRRRAVRERGRARLSGGQRRSRRGRAGARARRRADARGPRPRALAAAARRSWLAWARAVDRARADALRRHRRGRRRDDGQRPLHARRRRARAGRRSTLAGPANVDIDRSGVVPVARLSGEIDRANADQVAPLLLALAPGPVVVDLSGLAFFGSAGLQVLFGLANQCGRLAVVAPPGAPFRRALEIAELGRVAHVADSLAAALEHCGQP